VFSLSLSLSRSRQPLHGAVPNKALASSLSLAYISALYIGGGNAKNDKNKNKILNILQISPHVTVAEAMRREHDLMRLQEELTCPVTHKLLEVLRERETERETNFGVRTRLELFLFFFFFFSEERATRDKPRISFSFQEMLFFSHAETSDPGLLTHIFFFLLQDFLFFQPATLAS
jgi:hypothetical protein